MRVAGLAPVEDIPGLENIDVTELVNGHMAYRAAMPRLLREVGWEIESDNFVEIEDPVELLVSSHSQTRVDSDTRTPTITKSVNVRSLLKSTKPGKNSRRSRRRRDSASSIERKRLKRRNGRLTTRVRVTLVRVRRLRRASKALAVIKTRVPACFSMSMPSELNSPAR